MTIDAEGLGVSCLYESEEILEAAETQPTTGEQVRKQLAKLHDTVFTLQSLEFEECGAFLPVKLLNQARREIVNKLYEEKLRAKPRRVAVRETAAQTEETGIRNAAATDTQTAEAACPKENLCIAAGAAEAAALRARAAAAAKAPEDGMDAAARRPYLTASVLNRAQEEACLRAGIREIYFKNIVRRNQVCYAPREGKLLIGGYGGLHYYRDTNPFVTDYSFHVVNSAACRKLQELGAARVTLSYELNKKQISELIAAYETNYGARPSLEMIVYGRAPLLFTKYCPLKKMEQCGRCKQHQYELRDEYGSFPILSHEDCTTTILNGKFLNLLDEMPSIEGVEAFRLAFTTETPEEVSRVISAAQRKLDGREQASLFRKDTDTRGHYNKEII